MKKIIFLLVSLLCVLFVYPQAPVVEELKFDDYVNNVHNNSGTRSTALDFQGRIIYQRSIGFANLPYFNHYRVDTATHAYFEQALADLFIASNQSIFINYTTLRERVVAEEDIDNTVNVGIINARYDVFNYDETNPSNTNNTFILQGITRCGDDEIVREEQVATYPEAIIVKELLVMTLVSNNAGSSVIQ